MLAALVALPVIWYFLRLMPPKPRLEQFPPTRLLLEIDRKEEQPSRSPWWLTALRLALCAAVIFALAGPVFKPTGEVAPGSGPLLMVVDNSWASAGHWKSIVDTAHRVLALAQSENRPVALLATADAPNQSLTTADTSQISDRLDALAPRPWAGRYADLVPALADAAKAVKFGGVAWLSGGLGGDDVATFAKTLATDINGPILAYSDSGADIMGLTPPVGTADALSVTAVRRANNAPAAALIQASDIQGRVIGQVSANFAAGATTAGAKFTLPVELRNEIVRMEIVGASNAGAVQLLDDRYRRRRVGLLSGASLESAAQPLLDPLYYISRAAAPFADITQPNDANIDTAVPALLNAGCSVIAMADIGVLTPDIEKQVSDWVKGGGVLVRFAGPKLASASDSLVPVALREGDRVLGGSLSWATPQPLGSFSAQSPFAGLTVPTDVTVSRQVLAEPSGQLNDRTWAALADGTPLVTAAPSGKGWLILFHVTADTSWSNLPLSGVFVDMLRRIVAFSSASQGGTGTNLAQSVPPYRLLDGYGHFSPPTADAEPLAGDVSTIQPGATHPPGLYGTEDGFRALNLLNEDAALAPFDPSAASNVTVRPYPTASPVEISPWLIALAVTLLAIDALAVLWLNGGLRWRRRQPVTATIALFAAALLAVAMPHGSRADPATDQAAVDAFALKATDTTHLAYVITGDSEVDAVSLAGLRGLSTILAERTALEPGDPIGVDPSKDELTFFPLIYWAIAPNSPMPTPATMARIDAYMRQGGSVLFDTRDQLERSTQVNSLSGTPAGERLKAMLSGLDIPPLEPVPADHVLTKTFYLLNDFPGRYDGGPLWVQLTESATPADRPVAEGDGVSPILITENDFAGAWATDETGHFLYPTVPNNAMQREMAVRAGINIVMYTLTGNYKSDQVHVPDILERLGQ
jgi:Domain of unknown function (DUF4159)/Aerotolerance regulator N-terminal